MNNDDFVIVDEHQESPPAILIGVDVIRSEELTLDAESIEHNINIKNTETRNINKHSMRETKSLTLKPPLLVLTQQEILQHTDEKDDNVLDADSIAMKIESKDTVVRMVAIQLTDMINGVDKNGKIVNESKVFNNSTISNQIRSSNQSIEITNKIIQMAYDTFVELVDDKIPNTDNIVICIMGCIKIVEQTTNMKNGRRVELILSVLRKYIDSRNDMTVTEKLTIHEVLENTFPIVYNVSRNNQVVEKIKTFLKKCTCCK